MAFAQLHAATLKTGDIRGPMSREEAHDATEIEWDIIADKTERAAKKAKVVEKAPTFCELWNRELCSSALVRASAQPVTGSNVGGGAAAATEPFKAAAGESCEARDQS